MDKVKEKIKKLIDQEHKFSFTTYLMSSNHEQLFQWIIKTILQKYDKEDDYQTFIYTLVKELIMNGTKANLTEIYAKHYSKNILSTDDKVKKEEFNKLKKMLSPKSKEFSKIKRLSKEEQKSVKIYLSFNKHGIFFVVLNETELTKEQNLRIREKLKIADEVESIAEFFMSGEVDSTEGEGLGMVTIFTMMKEFGINPRYLTFYEDSSKAPIYEKIDNGTAVSLYIPFDKMFAGTFISEPITTKERRKYDKELMKKLLKI